jgi:molybdate transport system permease protein
VIGLAFMVLPFVGLLVRTPWGELGEHLSDPFVLAALRLSVVTSLAATALCLVIGVPLAWLLARTTFPGRSVVRGVVLLPMVLPPVVGGAVLLYALGRRGLVGQWLDRQFGFLLPFSTWGVIVAVTFIAMPFLVITVEAGLRGADQRFEEAAATLGASRLAVLRRVTLPMAWPSIVAGGVLAWARALGEFGATITFAGNLPGRTQTMPLAVFEALEADRGSALVLSLILVAVSLVVLVALRDRWFRVG